MDNISYDIASMFICQQSSILTKTNGITILYPEGEDMAYRPKDTQERILHRLKIAKGHLEKVITMVGDDVYCIDVLQQLNAVESEISGTGNVLLENHLKGCVADSISKGKKDEAINEIMQVFKKRK